jgi:hypothetical protein
MWLLRRTSHKRSLWYIRLTCYRCLGQGCQAEVLFAKKEQATMAWDQSFLCASIALAGLFNRLDYLYDTHRYVQARTESGILFG